jgi:hypothetical protein
MFDSIQIGPNTAKGWCSWEHGRSAQQAKRRRHALDPLRHTTT